MAGLLTFDSRAQDGAAGLGNNPSLGQELHQMLTRLDGASAQNTHPALTAAPGPGPAGGSASLTSHLTMPLAGSATVTAHVPPAAAWQQENGFAGTMDYPNYPGLGAHVASQTPADTAAAATAPVLPIPALLANTDVGSGGPLIGHSGSLPFGSNFAAPIPPQSSWPGRASSGDTSTGAQTGQAQAPPPPGVAAEVDPAAPSPAARAEDASLEEQLKEARVTEAQAAARLRQAAVDLKAFQEREAVKLAEVKAAASLRQEASIQESLRLTQQAQAETDAARQGQAYYEQALATEGLRRESEAAAAAATTAELQRLRKLTASYAEDIQRLTAQLTPKTPAAPELTEAAFAGLGPPQGLPPLEREPTLPISIEATLEALRHEITALPPPAPGQMDHLRAVVSHEGTSLDAALDAMLLAPQLIVALAALSCAPPEDPRRGMDHWLQAWLCLSIEARRAATSTTRITAQMVSAQVSALLGPYAGGKHGLAKVLRRVQHSEDLQPSPARPRLTQTREDAPRQMFSQPQFTPPQPPTASCVCHTVPCACGSTASAPLRLFDGQGGHTAGLPPPPPPPLTALDAMTKAIAGAIAAAATAGRDKDDDAKDSWSKYSKTAKSELDFKDAAITLGNSLEFAAMLFRLLDNTEEDAALKTLYAENPEMYDMIALKRAEDRQAVLTGRPGELLQDFGNYLHKSQLRRMAAAREEDKAGVAQQTGDAMHALQQHHQALLGPTHFGYIKDPTQQDSLLAAHERTIVEIALGFVQDPKTKKAHIAAGFAARPTVSAAKGSTATTYALPPAGGQAAPAGRPKDLSKRTVGHCLPTSSQIMGTMGVPKTSTCWACNKMGHDVYECPSEFARLTGTNMPGHDSMGQIADPNTYWKDGVVDSTISKEIASLWEGHSWAADFSFDATTKLNALAISRIAQGF